MTRIVSLDLATTTGWAIYVDGLQASGFRRLVPAGSGPVERLEAARRWLPEGLREIAWGRGDLVYEAPMAHGGQSSRRSQDAIRSALHLEAALLLSATSLGVPSSRIYTYHLATMKKAATGSGKAKKPEVVAAMAARWGLPALKDDNEADALSALHLHLQRIS